MSEKKKLSIQLENRKIWKTGILLFWIYLKSMAFAFTGGMVAIPLIQFEVVKRYGFLSDDEYLEIIALSNALPGIIGVNNSILTGYKICGVFGAVMAASGTILPAFFSMVIVAIIFQKLPQSRIVNGAIRGIRAVSVAVIFDIGIRIFLRYKKDAYGLCVLFLALCIPLFTGVSAFYTILLSGLIGIIYVGINRKKKQGPASEDRD
ncbi:MAG: chromate transporter [Flexilinea sp.]